MEAFMRNNEAINFNPVGVRGWAPLPRWMIAGVAEDGQPTPKVEPSIVDDPLEIE
jgi:hypothetical protein